MAISLNTVNSEVVRAHKRIDAIGSKDISVIVTSRISILKIHNTVHITVVFDNNRRLDIASNLLPKTKVLGQGITPVSRSGLNIACPSEFELSPDGSFERIRNVEGSTDTGAWGLAIFVYNL